MSRIYKTSYRSTRGVKRFGVEFTAPPPPQSEKERLLANIRKEKEFIEAHPAYSGLCAEARVRLISSAKQLAELRQAEKHAVLKSDPRTPEQKSLDEWQADWKSTYEEMAI